MSLGPGSHVVLVSVDGQNAKLVNGLGGSGSPIKTEARIISLNIFQAILNMQLSLRPCRGQPWIVWSLVVVKVRHGNSWLLLLWLLECQSIADQSQEEKEHYEIDSVIGWHLLWLLKKVSHP